MKPKRFDKSTTLTLQYDAWSATLTPPMEFSAIKDAVVQDCTDELNTGLDDDRDGRHYSPDQVKAAMWQFMSDEIDTLLENIADRFLCERTTNKEHLLGDPEIDLAEERRLEATDYAYDRAHGN